MRVSKLGRVGQIVKTKLSDWGWKRIVSFGFATLVPTFIFTGVALNRPISFDGGMNLQVAQNMLEKGEYSRSYSYPKSTEEEKSANNRLFPNEVETNGPYIIAAATGMMLFGQSQPGYQFANLLFIFGLAVVVWWMLKRWIIVATIAPPLVLLLLPASFDTSLGGYGEVPALFFAMLAIAYVTHSMTLKNQAQVLKYISFAMVAAGAAIVTKTYLVGFVPALLLGVLIVKITKDIPYKSLIPRSLYLLLVPALYELWHLISIGSVHDFLVWWKHQLGAILLQSGIRKPGGSTSIWEKLESQVDIFTNSAALAPVILLAVSAISVAIFAGYARRHKNIQAAIWHAIKSKHGVLLIMLVSMFITYLVWWLFFLPEAKTFIRRALPVMLPLEVALAILVAIGASLYIKLGQKKKLFTELKSGWVITGGLVLYIGSVVALAILLIPAVSERLESAQKTPYLTVSDYEDTVKALKDVPKDAKLYGFDWWSSPVVGLMSERDMYNLRYIDLCTVDSQKDIFVWDKVASGITQKKDPTTKLAEFKLYKETGAARLYTIVPTAQCQP